MSNRRFVASLVVVGVVLLAFGAAVVADSAVVGAITLAFAIGFWSGQLLAE